MAQPALRERLRLRLLGNADAETCEAMAANPAVDVEVLPPVSWEEAIERIRGSDVVVVAQPTELGDDIAWPVKIFEALALGKPILSITGGGAVERLLGELGQPAGCARHGDAGSIAAALQRLLAAPPAPVPPASLAAWNRSEVASDYAALLDELVARAG
jgi:glycosyltransferase involved in cell wall biosynthesis